MKAIFLLMFLFVISIGNCIAQQKEHRLADKDKAQILKSILLDENLKNREARDIINLSLENIAPRLIPAIEGISFVFMDRKQIKEKTQSGLSYYAFGPFKLEGPNVLIKFGHYFENVQGGASYSGGLTYKFRRVRGKWKGMQIDGWGSIS